MLTIIAVITSIIVVISSTTTSFADAACTGKELLSRLQTVRQQCIASQCNSQCTRDMCQLVETIKSCPNPNGVNVGTIVGAYNQSCIGPLPLDKSNTCRILDN
jgi:hypothetical protein